MGNEALWEAIRRSVEERNSDPEKMRRWLDDWEDRSEAIALAAERDAYRKMYYELLDRMTK